MVVLLLWYPTFQYITLYEFEMLRFSIPVILWMLYFHDKNKMVFYFLFVLLAILVREEVALTVMMFGLYLTLFRKRWRIGLLTAFAGLASFFIIVDIIMPALRDSSGEHIALSVYNKFGSSFSGIIMNAAKNPATTISQITQPVKMANIFMLFLPLLFISLLAPSVLICCLANLAVVLLSDFPTHSSYMLYYISPSVPFIFYAFIKAWPRLCRVAGKFSEKHSSPNVEGRLISGVLAGLIVANIFFGPSPISLQFWFRSLRPAPFRTQDFHYTAYIPTEHTRLAESFVNLIPDSAVVSAEHFFHPRLIRKKAAIVFPQLESLDGRTKADYVLIDKNNPVKTGVGTVPGSWDGLRTEPQKYYDIVEKNPDQWKLIRSEDGCFLYKRVQTPSPKD